MKQPLSQERTLKTGREIFDAVLMMLDVENILLSHGASDLGQPIGRDHGEQAIAPLNHRIVNGHALEKEDQGREPAPSQSVLRLLSARDPHLIETVAIPVEEGIAHIRPPFPQPTANVLMHGVLRDADDPPPKADNPKGLELVVGSLAGGVA